MNTFSPSNTSAFDHILMLMDASPNFIIITDGHHASAANKTLLDFLTFPPLRHFPKTSSVTYVRCLNPMPKILLLPQMGDRTWIEEVLASPDAHLAYVKHRDTLYAFKIFMLVKFISTINACTALLTMLPNLVKNAMQTIRGADRIVGLEFREQHHPF